MIIEIDERSARITKRGVTVWVNNGKSMHSITLTKSSWRFLLRETRGVNPKQVAFNQLVRND
jgi:hypothetical protein